MARRLTPLVLLLLCACSEPVVAVENTRTPRTPIETHRYLREPIQPLERPSGLRPQEVELGDRLFHDPRLSAEGSISCASCHAIAQGGDDGRPRSLGVRGQVGGINAPTVLNSGLNIAQFWDGRAGSLEEQVNGPVTHPKEMGSTWEGVVKSLSSDAEYVRRFAALYPDGITPENVRRAISTFERSLVAVDSPFDRWLRGDDGALNEEEIAGYRLFQSVGCVACHQGRNVGGNMYQRFGVLGDYFEDRGGVTPEDLGRFNVTQREEDRFSFRVPSLRMVEHTAPYFHDGSAQSLEDAIRVMAKYQLGRHISEQDVSRIASFLRTLDGEIPEVLGAVALSGGPS